jgi:hypothetical protein
MWRTPPQPLVNHDCRALARWLRQTAEGNSADRDPIRPRHDVLPCERISIVRSELLELADLLERTDDCDPDLMEALRALLSSDRDSPLYDPHVNVCELRAGIGYIRRRLATARPTSAKAPR